MTTTKISKIWNMLLLIQQDFTTIETCQINTNILVNKLCCYKLLQLYSIQLSRQIVQDRYNHKSIIMVPPHTRCPSLTICQDFGAYFTANPTFLLLAYDYELLQKDYLGNSTPNTRQLVLPLRQSQGVTLENKCNGLPHLN